MERGAGPPSPNLYHIMFKSSGALLLTTPLNKNCIPDFASRDTIQVSSATAVAQQCVVCTLCDGASLRAIRYIASLCMSHHVILFAFLCS